MRQQSIIGLYHKYPHYLLYWAYCKSSYKDLESWAKFVEEMAKDRGAVSSVLYDAIKFYRTHQIK